MTGGANVCQPALEHPHRPEGVTAFGRSRLMSHESLPQCFHIKVIGDTRTRFQHFSAELVGIWPGDPLADWRCEPTFGKLPQLAGQTLAGECSQEGFPLTTLLFFRLRDRKRQLHDPPIEEWTPHFKTMRHAHPIHLHQWIVGHVDFEVRVFGALDWIATWATSVRFSYCRIDWTPRCIWIR